MVTQDDLCRLSAHMFCFPRWRYRARLQVEERALINVSPCRTDGAAREVFFFFDLGALYIDKTRPI
jgi:hypothetical protein